MAKEKEEEKEKEPWEEYIGKDMTQIWEDEFMKATNILRDVNINKLSEGQKNNYLNILYSWRRNSILQRQEYSIYLSEMNAKIEQVIASMGNTPTPTPNPTSPTIEAPTTKPSGGKDYLFASEGVDFDWKNAVNLRIFNTTDLASVAPQAEMYVKTDISEIDDIDKYLIGIEMIVGNNLWKTDSIYRPIYDMTQTRLDELSFRINLTAEQRNKINNLKEQTEDAK